MVDVDHAYCIHTYLFGLIKDTQQRRCRQGGKWITIGGGGGGAAPTAGGGEVYDVEMKVLN